MHSALDSNFELNALSANARPRIRSFVRRTGRVTSGQMRALQAHSKDFVLSFSELAEQTQPNLGCDWDSIFSRPAPLVLEIGFGMGEASAHIASLKPDVNFIGCEVHTPGVGALLKRIHASHISNFRIIQHDAVEVLEQLVSNHSLDGVHIFFPDPWHKKRHHKRRLIQEPLATLLVQKLKSGGYIHVATDWQHYAEQIVSVLQAQRQLVNTSSGESPYVSKPDYRPLTKFEKRGLRLGHGVWDIIFTKI